MQNLDEKIDSLLYESLLEQDKKLVKRVVKHDNLANQLGEFLSVDDKDHGLELEDLKYLISFFVKVHQEEAREKGIELTLKEQTDDDMDPEYAEFLKNVEPYSEYVFSKPAGDLKNNILKDPESRKYPNVRNYLMNRKDGSPPGRDLGGYNLKKLIWAAKKLGFYQSEDVGDFDPTAKPQEPEPEKEKAPEAGEEKSEQPKLELSPQEQKEVDDYMDRTVHLLALQTILDGKRRPLPKYGQLIRKYFIEKEVLRQGTLAEELFEQEKEKPKEPPKTNNTDDGQKRDDMRAIRRGMYKKRPPTPEEAKESYESLIKAMGISSERDPSAVLNKKIEVEKPDIDDDRYEELLQDNKFLIYTDAGKDKDYANEMSKKNPFINMLQEDSLRPRVLNLNDFKKQNLDEGMLGMFGAWIEYALKGIFGGWGSNLKIVGSKRDVESFARTLSGEARYIEAAKRYGLDHPTTYKNKSSLDVAVRNFEKDTGIKWPFK